MGLFVRTYTKALLSSIDIVGIRAISTCMIIFIWLLFYNRKLFYIKLKDLWCFLGTGIGSIVFFNYCYFKAITLTSMSVAAVLLYTAPAIVMVLSYFLFREHFTKLKIFSLIMTLVGCSLVTGILGSNEPLSIYGGLVGLGAGLGYALYSIFSRCAIQRGYHSLTIMFYTFFCAAICSVPLIDLNVIQNVCSMNRGMIGFTLVFGMISIVVPYGLYTYALNGIENGKAAIIATIEPVVATIVGTVIYKEAVTLNEIFGILCIIGAIVLCNIKKE